MLNYYLQNYKIVSNYIIFILYILFISLKPSFCFDEDENLLQFGLNYKNKTILLWLITILYNNSYFSIYYFTFTKFSILIIICFIRKIIIG